MRVQSTLNIYTYDNMTPHPILPGGIRDYLYDDIGLVIGVKFSQLGNSIFTKVILDIFNRRLAGEVITNVTQSKQ